MIPSSLTASDVDVLLQAAIAAPSMHNVQPWRFDVRDDTSTIALYADRSRVLPVADPSSRAAHIGCGAALLNLRLAASVALGREPVARLLPDPADPTHLADVRLAGPHLAVGTEERELHDAILRRHTNRSPFTGEPVPTPVLADLAVAAVEEGAELHLPGARETASLLELIRDVDREQSFDSAFREELARWTTSPSSPAEGVPAGAAGPRAAGRALPLRAFNPTVRRVATFEAVPQLAVLLTNRDAPADWLRAGQALQRVLLLATARGLAVSFLNQPLEDPDNRRLVRDPLHGVGHPHMILRIGYPTEPAAATPRRSTAEVRRSRGAENRSTPR